jgi:hypothetical protein
LQPWVKTFPADFIRRCSALRGMDYRSDTVRRPRYFGLLTNDIVYDRLLPARLKTRVREPGSDKGHDDGKGL